MKLRQILQSNYELECVLCSVSDATYCKDCFLPWNPEWKSGIDSEAAGGAGLRLDDPENFVCFQCVAEGEFGLAAKEQLTEDQRGHLAKVEALAEKLGGFPGVELLSALTIPFATKSTKERPASETAAPLPAFARSAVGGQSGSPRAWFEHVRAADAAEERLPNPPDSAFIDPFPANPQPPVG